MVPPDELRIRALSLWHDAKTLREEMIRQCYEQGQRGGIPIDYTKEVPTRAELFKMLVTLATCE